MRRWTLVVASGVGLAALAGCAGSSRPAPATGAGTSTKTFVLGPFRIDPANMTIGASDAVGFMSTATNALQVEFVQPKDQTGITCRLTDPSRLERGQAPWAEFRVNPEGHLRADVPPGQFPSTCTFKPGSYSFTVKVMDQARPLDEKLGQIGTITVK